MRGNPRPAKSYTGGEKSSLPLNHGFTVCWSEETTSVRWPGMSERTWLASTCPASASSPARLKASRQLPTAITALLQVRFELARVPRLELAIHVGIELQLEVAVGHLTLRSFRRITPPGAAGARATAAT